MPARSHPGRTVGPALLAIPPTAAYAAGGITPCVILGVILLAGLVGINELVNP